MSRDPAAPARFMHAPVREALARAGVDASWPRLDAVDVAIDAAVAAARGESPMPAGYSAVIEGELWALGVDASRSTIANRKSERFRLGRATSLVKTELSRPAEELLSRDGATGVERWRVASGRVVRRGPRRCLCCPREFYSEDMAAHRMCDSCRRAA